MSNLEWNKEKPLERLFGVSRRANQALRDYAKMGSGRSQRKLIKYYKEQAVSDPLARQPTLIYSTLSRWSYQFDWVARVDAWTKIQQEREQAEWEDRRRQIRQQDWEHGQQLRELADTILEAAPAFVKRREKTDKGETRVRREETGDGEVTITKTRVDTRIVTVALDGHLLTRLEKLASDLGRLSSEVPPVTQELDIKSGGEPIKIREVIVELPASAPVEESGAN